MDLIGVDPPRYGVGYWLSADATGQGYASAALRALIALGRDELGISDLYAGVTHGNGPSEALFRRMEFERVATFETYTRFRLDLGQSPA